MTNLEYWDDRMRRRLVKAEMRGALAIEKTLALYEDALKNINREINQIYEKYSTEIGLDVGELVQILSGTEKAEFLKKIHEKMAKLGFDVKDLYNSKYLSRLTRLEAIKQQIYWEIQALAKKEIAIQTKAYEDIIRDSYQASLVDIREMKLEDTGYSFAKGTGLDLGTFGTLNKGAVKQILRSDWEGRNYVNSATINRDKFAQRVQVIVGSGLARGVSAEKMRRQIREEFGTAKYNTMRLIRTETSYYQNQADYASYVAEGVQYYRFTAVMDGLTSDICRAHNNKVYRVSDAIVGYNFPPLHPNCRSRTVMAFKEDIAKGVAEVPESIKRRNEKDDITSGLFETQMKGLISEGYKREELVDFNELPPKDYDLDFIIEQNKTLEEGIADLLKSGEMEFDKDWIVSKINELDVVDYKIQTEGWFRDCMESRGLGKTTQEACSLYAEDIMRSERGDGKIVASGFVKDVEGAEYGVSWIAEEIRRQGKGQVAKEFMDYDVTPTLYDMTMGGKLEIKQLPSDDEDIEYYDAFWEGKKVGGMEFLRPTDTSPNGLIGMIFLDPEAGRGKGISPRMVKYLFDKHPKMPNISLEVGEKQFQYWEHLGAKLSDKEKELIEKEGWESESGGGRVATLSREDFNKYIERKTQAQYNILPPTQEKVVFGETPVVPFEKLELNQPEDLLNYGISQVADGLMELKSKEVYEKGEPTKKILERKGLIRKTGEMIKDFFVKGRKQPAYEYWNLVKKEWDKGPTDYWGKSSGLTANEADTRFINQFNEGIEKAWKKEIPEATDKDVLDKDLVVYRAGDFKGVKDKGSTGLFFTSVKDYAETYEPFGSRKVKEYKIEKGKKIYYGSDIETLYAQIFGESIKGKRSYSHEEWINSLRAKERRIAKHFRDKGYDILHIQREVFDNGYSGRTGKYADSVVVLNNKVKILPLGKENVLPTQEFKPMTNKEIRKYIEKRYLPDELSLDRFKDPVDLLSFIYEGWSGKCTQEQRELIDALKDMRMVEFLSYTGLKREAEEQYAFTTALRNDKIRRSVFGLGKEYKGVKSFNKMNAWLRSKDPLKNADMTDENGVPLIKSLKKVDESFAEAKTKMDLQFYRGVQWRENYDESMFKVGNTIRDRGFGYVSLSRDFASGYGSVNPKYGALLKIQAKAGSRIINGWDYGVQSTNESVIDRDSLYKVLKVEKGERGQTEITLELIQQPKKGIGELSKDVLPAKSAKPVKEQKEVEFTSGTDIKLDKYLSNYLKKEGIRIEETLKPEPLRRTAGTYDATTNTIQLVNRETTERWVDKTRVDTSREFTLLHEIGHTIENLVEDRIPEWLPYLSKDMKPTEEALAIAKKRFEIATLNDYPYMSQKKVNEMYSKMEKRYIDYISRPDEVFAEGWAQYKKTPSQLKRVAPNMYKFYTSVDKMLKEKYG